MTTMFRRKAGLSALFMVPGIGISSWVTRTPAIRDQIGASTAEMGMVLFGLSVGSLLGILSSGPLVSRLGARLVAGVGTASVAISMPVIGLGAMSSSSLAVGIGLGLFGLGMGSGEIALNVEGGQIERLLGTPFLPSLHGFFSLGTVIGATAGIIFTALSFSVVAHLLIVGVIAVMILVTNIAVLAADTGKIGVMRAASAVSAERKNSTWSLMRDSRLVMIGLIILALALAEGTANDWLPLVMVDGHGLDPSLGSAVYTVFAVSMTIGRFCGGRIVQAFGRSRVLAASALFAAAGLFLVSVVDHQVVAVAAVVLWGLGASLGFPVAISAAGDSGPNAPARVSLASTVGYLAFLVGPPALGLLGDTVGLRGALLAPMVVVLIAVFFTPAARPVPAPERHHEHTTTP